MATTITVNAPFLAPTLDSVTTAAGGTYPAGTYQFVVFNEYGWDIRYFPSRSSAPSNIISGVVVPAGSRITVNWTKNEPSATSNIVYIMYNRGIGWMPLYYYGVANTGTYTSAVTPAYQYMGKNWMYEHSGVRPFGLSNTRGVGLIAITGTGNFTTKNIYDAIVASGAVAGEDYAVTNGIGLCANYTIDARTYGAGIFTMTGTMYLAGGFSNIGSSLTIAGGAFINPMTFGIVGNPNGYSFANCDINGLVALVPYQPVIVNSPYGNYGNVTFTSGVVKNYINYYTSLTGINYVSGAASNYLSLGGAQTLSDGMADQTIRLTLTPDNNYTIRRCKLWCYAAYSILSTPNSGKVFTILDSDFWDVNSGLKKTNEQIFGYGTNYFYRYANTSATLTNAIDIKKTLQYIITTTAGVKIAGVSIVLKDRLDNTVFTDVTDANGSLTKETLIYRTESKPLGTAVYPTILNCVNTDYNPFTVTITKAGYEKYKGDFILNSPTNYTITLKNTNRLKQANNYKSM